MRRHVPEDVETALGRLAQRVDSLRHEIGELKVLRTTLDSHGRALTQLSGLVSQVGTTAPAAASPAPAAAAASSTAPPVPEWLAVSDPALAVAWLTDLTIWVPRVWMRYPSSRLTPCWPWHPAVVSEVLVVRHMWATATTPGMPVDALAAWHDRWRPAANARVGRSLTGCERGAGCHVNVAGHHFQYDLAYLDELAEWWATTDRPNLEAAPGLRREHGHHDRQPARLAERAELQARR